VEADSYEKDVDENIKYIERAVSRGDYATLLGHVAHSLFRTAMAQERLVTLAEADLEAQVEEAVKSRTEERAAEIAAEKTKRSYIGKK